MKLNEFLDIADDDDMIEVYADDGATRPCKLKLVNVFNVSDWVGGISDVVDELMLYLNREVTCVATVKLDVPEDGEIVAMRVYVEQEEGDEAMLEAEEDQDESGGDKHNGHEQTDEKLQEHLMYAYSVLRDFVKDMDGDWTMSKETAETLIQGAIDRIVAAGKCVGMDLNNYRED